MNMRLNQYKVNGKAPANLEEIASKYLRNRRNDRTIIKHALCCKNYSGIIEYGQLLKESGKTFGFDLVTKTGETLVRLAAERKDEGIVSLMEEYSKSLNNINQE